MDFLLERVIPWSLLIIFFIHDGEEVIFLPGWIRKNTMKISQIGEERSFLKPAVNFLLKTTSRQFGISVFFLLILILAVSFLTYLHPTNFLFSLIYLGTFSIFSLHFFVHIAQSIFIHQLVPGTVTSIILFPITLKYWMVLVSRFGFSINQIFLSLGMGVLVLGMGFGAVLFLGNLFDRA